MGARLAIRLAVTLLALVPRGLVSRLAGFVASRRLPGPLQRLQIRLYGRLVGVDFDEVRDPIESFPTLQSFFVRRLKDGLRPIDPAPDAVVSPCDGFWGVGGTVENGTVLQVKGRAYSLGALLGADEDAQRFEGGTFLTLYLSPKDYHRFHTPCDLRFTRLVYLPGTLWPVNRVGIEGVDGIFARNERLCAFARAGDGELAIVAVGALVVGKVKVELDELTTNVGGAPTERRYEPGHAYPKGAEWGRFELGSTLVLVATPGLLRIDPGPAGTPLRLGTRIGTLLGPPPAASAGLETSPDTAP